MKKRPKTSGILRKRAMPKKLTTSAFWGDITKGHASSLEIASKVLIEDEPEEGYDDENTETQRTKTRVVGLSNAPSNFRFKGTGAFALQYHA